MLSPDELKLLQSSHKTIAGILEILSQQDGRIKQLELHLGLQAKSSNKDFLVKKLEQSLEKFDKNVTVEGLKNVIDEISSILAWNSNRIMRLEKQIG